jgi:uncharacterized protein YhaN
MSFLHQLAAPSVETLQKSPLYEALIQRLQILKNDAESYKQKCAELTPQVDQLREQQEDFKEKLIVLLIHSSFLVSLYSFAG